MKRFQINSNDAGQRVDKFLTKAVPRLPTALMYKYIRTKRIKLNGSRCEISTRLSCGDIIEMYINDDFFGGPSEKDFLTVQGGVEIVYEDENILIADKPCGLLVHEDDGGISDTLINRIKKYLCEKGEYIPDNEQSFAPSLCNRLDRNTTGLVICAKNAETLRFLNQAIKDRAVKKRYLCCVLGTPKPKEAVIRAYLIKKQADNMVSIYDKPQQSNDCKEIVTGYRVLCENGGLSLCEINLITGRTHQIRAHMAYIGHPVLGDGKYGRNAANRSYSVKTQALQAYKLRFELGDGDSLLSYLNGREFEAKPAWFLEKFFPEYKL